MEKIKGFLFKNQSIKQTVTKNAFWLFTSEGIGRILKFIFVIYATRLLGVKDWGIFSYALSLGSLLMVFSDVGINSIVTREIAQKKEGFKDFVSTAITLKVFLSIFSTLLVIFLGAKISHIPEAQKLLPFIAITLCFDAFRDLILSINMAYEKMEKEIIVKTLMSFFTLLLGIILLQIKPVPHSVAIVYAIGSIVGCIIALFVVWNKLKLFLFQIDKILLKKIARITLSFALIAIVTNITMSADIYLLGLWSFPEEIGSYTSAQRIYQFILLIPAVITSAILPLQSRLAVGDSRKFVNILEKMMALLFVVALPICVGGIITSDKIIYLIFGDQFTRAIPIFQMFLLTLLASFPLVLFSNTLIARNEQKKLALFYAIGMFVNIISNLVLIPRTGGLGAAISTLISTTTTTVLIGQYLYQPTRFQILSKLGLPIVSIILTLPFLLLMKFLNFSLFIEILAITFIYPTILFLLKEPVVLEIKSTIERKILS